MSIPARPATPWRVRNSSRDSAARQLLGRRLESRLHAAAALPDLLIYGMHLVDLVPDGRIGKSPGPLWLKAAQLLSRRRQRGFADFGEIGELLTRRGYRLATMTDCYELLTGVGP